MMITTNEARKISELAYVAKEWDCTIEEAAAEIIYEFYAAAGFRREQLEAEFGHLRGEALLKAFCNM